MEMHLSGVAGIAAQGGCSGRVCALPLPSCDHLTSLAHQAWQNENSELLETFLAVPDEPEMLERGAQPGLLLLSVLGCWCPRDNSERV